MREPTTDRSVLEAQLKKMRTGDRLAWNFVFTHLGDRFKLAVELLKRKYPSLAAYEQTNDILQEACLKLIKQYANLERIPEKANELHAHASRVIRDIGIDRTRKYIDKTGRVKIKAEPISAGLAVVKQETAVAVRAIRKQERERIQLAIDHLDDVDQQIVLLDLDKLSWVEIAEALGMTTARVQSRHAKAIRRLKVLLKDLGGRTG